jgi:hypothetical protein
MGRKLVAPTADPTISTVATLVFIVDFFVTVGVVVIVVIVVTSARHSTAQAETALQGDSTDSSYIPQPRNKCTYQVVCGTALTPMPS